MDSNCLRMGDGKIIVFSAVGVGLAPVSVLNVQKVSPQRMYVWFGGCRT